MKRVIFDLLLFVSIFIFPWWVSIFLLFIGIFIFDNFYEFIIFGVVIYAIYSTKNGQFISSPFFYSGILIFSYIIIQFIRDNIILYKTK